MLAIAGLLSAVASVVLPVGKWLQAPLAARCLVVQPPPARIDGIVLLGGGPPIDPARPLPAIYAVAIDLARDNPNARLLLTGSRTVGQAIPESDQLAAMLRGHGVSPQRLLLEPAARVTAENARLGHAIAQPAAGARWVLLTFPAHMPRAYATFRTAGWPVLPYAVSLGDPAAMATDLPGLRRNAWQLGVALHELGGLLVYRLRGWTDDLLPACPPITPPAAPARPADSP